MEAEKKKVFTIITAATIIIIVMAFAVFYFVRKANQKEVEVAEIVEQMNFEKEQVQKEYSNLNQ